jgi:hypothetical protein
VPLAESTISNRKVLSGSITVAQRIIIPATLLLALCGGSIGQYFPEVAFDAQKESNDFVVSMLISSVQPANLSTR